MKNIQYSSQDYYLHYYLMNELFIYSVSIRVPCTALGQEY